MTLFPMAGLALLGVHESDDEPVIQSQFTICSNNHPLEPLHYGSCPSRRANLSVRFTDKNGDHAEAVKIWEN